VQARRQQLEVGRNDRQLAALGLAWLADNPDNVAAPDARVDLLKVLLRDANPSPAG
jgi:hypothetical protein